MVETLLGRCVAPAQEWCFNLWPAVVCVLLVLFSSVSSSRLSFFFSAEFSAAGSWAAPSVRSLTRKHTPLLKSAAGIVRICGIECTGTGTSGGGLWLGENRRRDFGFGLTGRRWRCGLRGRLRLHILHLHLCRRPHTHPSKAWVGHPLLLLSRRRGLRWDRLRWLPMLREIEGRITTGSRGGLPRC